MVPSPDNRVSAFSCWLNTDHCLGHQQNAPQVPYKTFLSALSCLITFKKEIKREERDTPVVIPHVLLARSVVPRYILYTAML
jgi:hypothetical protein